MVLDVQGWEGGKCKKGMWSKQHPCSHRFDSSLLDRAHLRQPKRCRKKKESRPGKRRWEAMVVLGRVLGREGRGGPLSLEPTVIAGVVLREGKRGAREPEGCNVSVVASRHMHLTWHFATWQFAVEQTVALPGVTPFLPSFQTYRAHTHPHAPCQDGGPPYRALRNMIRPWLLSRGKRGFGLKRGHERAMGNARTQKSPQTSMDYYHVQKRVRRLVGKCAAPTNQPPSLALSCCTPSHPLGTRVVHLVVVGVSLPCVIRRS